MKTKEAAKRAVSSDNVAIHYWRSWSSEMRKPFILLHSAASLNHTSLHGLEQGLNELGYPTITFDQRGIGYSEAPLQQKCYTLDKHTEDIQAIINKEGLENPILLTHSFGFMPAVNYAAKTENVSKIIGICASHNFAETAGFPLPKVLRNFDFIENFAEHAAFKIFGKCGPINEFAGYLINISRHMLKAEEQKYPNQNLAGKSAIAVWLSLLDVPFREIRAHFEHSRELNNWDISEQLKKLEIPLHLIYGGQDSMVMPYAAYKIRELSKGECKIDVVEGGHTLPVIHPERVLKVMNR